MDPLRGRQVLDVEREAGRWPRQTDLSLFLCVIMMPAPGSFARKQHCLIGSSLLFSSLLAFSFKGGKEGKRKETWVWVLWERVNASRRRVPYDATFNVGR